MKRREVLAVLAATAVTESAPLHAQSRWRRNSNSNNDSDSNNPARFTKQIDLPHANAAGTVSLEEAIARRRSVRRYRPDAIPLASIGQLLWAGQGITRDNDRRAAPSAGALYPLELYTVSATEIMHYLPQGHRAETRSSNDLRPELRALSVDQASVGTAPLLIAVAAESARLNERYGARAVPYTNMEVGHATQNILLQAVVLGLAAVPVGAVDGPGAARALGLPAGQTVAYLVPVGYPA